jgi:GH35 family endo-1,4-beta-xylanase
MRYAGEQRMILELQGGSIEKGNGDMKKIISGLFGLALLLHGSASPATAQSANDDFGGPWRFVGAEGQGASGSEREFPLTLNSRSGSYNGYEPRWEQPLQMELKAGHVYTVTLRARAVNPRAVGSTAFKFALSPVKKPKLSHLVFTCGPVLSGEWETFSAPFSVQENIPAGKLSCFLVHGFGEAAIEVQDVRVEDRGADKPLQAYARTGRWYTGQETNQAWRTQAQEMIATNRMGTFSIQVVDGQGEPVEDARIIIEQQTHAYRFGVALNAVLAKWIAPGAESNPALLGEFQYYKTTSGRTELTFSERKREIEKYFEVLKSDFNYVVLENAFKWEAWCGEWGGFKQEDTLALADWLNEQGIAVKGHTLVWPGWRHSPEFLKGMTNNPVALNRLVHAHIADVGTAMNGRVVAVDVLNEVFNNNDFMKLLGNDIMPEWFKLAREVLPDAQLNVNDFLIMANGGYWEEKLDFYDNLVGSLVEDGAPIDGIGFQNHYRHNFLTGPERIWELCDRFGRYGLSLVCSEFDVNLADEALQAAYTRDFLTAWFAHPDTNAFLQWGYWQDSHWLPYAGLYDRDWRMKPNAKVYRDLVYNQWWSGWEEARTGADGKTALRGFLGDYRITAYAHGREVSLDGVRLKKEGTELSVRL